MKTVVALLVSLAFAGGLVAQEAQPAPVPTLPPAPAKKSDARRIDLTDPQKPDAKKTDAKKDDTKKKKEEPPPPKIEGIQIPRPDGRILAIRVVDNVFRLSFFDAKKKAMPPDFEKAALRWKNNNKLAQETTLLTPGGDDHSLTSGKSVRPPLAFKLYINLLADAADGTETAAESYVVDFAQQ